MGSKDNKAIRDELALRDFGTTEVPSMLRGNARDLAQKLGCTPREALDKLMEERDESDKNQERLKKRRRRVKRARRKAKEALQAKKSAEVGRPAFRSLVSGGLPGSGKRR